MDSFFGIFFGALAIIAFGACIGAGLRGRPGRLFGLAILKIGLACLFVLLLFVDSFPHNEIILWLVLMLMAGALICFGGACWLVARSMSRRGRIDGNAEARLSPLFSRPFSHIPLRRARPGFPSFPFPAGGEAGRRLSAGYPAFLQ